MSGAFVARRARLIAAVLSLLVIGLVVALATRSSSPGATMASSLGGKIAPPVSGVAINSGRRVSLASLRGRYVVLDFFASWCEPCLAEVPQLSRFVFEHRGPNAPTVLGVDIDDSLSDGRAFLERVGARWPAIEDANATIAQAYGVADPPRAFVVDPAGRVVATFSSGVTATQLDAVLAAARARAEMASLSSAPRRPFSLGATLGRPVSLVALGIVLVAALVIGSIHPTVPSASARITYLESVIKCPPCSGLSIAQSEVPQARALRTSVSAWVSKGWSDRAIEAKVSALYGQDEILRPNSPWIWVVPIALIVLAITVLVVVLGRRRRLDVPLEVSEEDEALVARARKGVRT